MLAGLGIALALVVAACIGGAPAPSGSGGSSPSAASSISPAPPSTASTASTEPSGPPASASTGVLPSDSAAASPAIAIDPGLLDILPAQLGGLDRQHDPSIDAGAFSDPSLPGIATAGSTALYIDPTTAQFAYVAVLRLVTGDLTDAQYRDWRDTFDTGACSQAGGVGGHSESTIGGHDTFIGTCTGGLTTYHTILAGRGLLISVSSVGDRRLGELLVSQLPS